MLQLNIKSLSSYSWTPFIIIIVTNYLLLTNDKLAGLIQSKAEERKRLHFSQPPTTKTTPPSFEMENALPKHFKALKICLLSHWFFWTVKLSGDHWRDFLNPRAFYSLDCKILSFPKSICLETQLANKSFGEKSCLERA